MKAANGTVAARIHGLTNAGFAMGAEIATVAMMCWSSGPERCVIIEQPLVLTVKVLALDLNAGGSKVHLQQMQQLDLNLLVALDALLDKGSVTGTVFEFKRSRLERSDEISLSCYQ
jgi:hypothetical protein